MAKNTTKSINEAKQVSQAQLDEEIRKAGQALLEQKKVKVTIPKVLRNRLGSEIAVGVNGAVVVVPVDGQAYELPESIAEVLNASLAELDAHLVG